MDQWLEVGKPAPVRKVMTQRQDRDEEAVAS